MVRKGRFIMIDGIAGSGKSTLLRSVQTWIEQKNLSVFRLSDWNNVEPPDFENVGGHDVFFTYEPTRTWIGRAIRYELSRVDKSYGGDALAHAFALDRQIMYKRLILPALHAGKTIIQDRGICTSLVYQPLMEQAPSLEMIMELPGNRLALKHAPDALILTRIPVKVAHSRIKQRTDESKGVFTDQDFLQKVGQRFKEQWLRDLFEQHGTSVHELDTSGNLEQTEIRFKQIIESILI